MIFNKEDVLNFLPHRDPFLFVDEIEEFDTSVRDLSQLSTVKMKDLIDCGVSGYYTPPKDHPIFKGHFPGNPIFPGVCQIEMMAQISSFVTTFCIENDFNAYDVDLILVGVDKSRFRQPVVPEMRLNVKSRLMKARGEFLSFYSEVRYENEVISECDFLARCRFIKKS